MISVEKTSKIFYHLRIGVSEGTVLSLLEHGLLRRAHMDEITFIPQYSRYNFYIDRGSLQEYLLDRGIKEEEVSSLLPA